MVENPEFVLMDLTKFLAISGKFPTIIEFFALFKVKMREESLL